MGVRQKKKRKTKLKETSKLWKAECHAHGPLKIQKKKKKCLNSQTHNGIEWGWKVTKSWVQYLRWCTVWFAEAGWKELWPRRENLMEMWPAEINLEKEWWTSRDYVVGTSDQFLGGKRGRGEVGSFSHSPLSKLLENLYRYRYTHIDKFPYMFLYVEYIWYIICFFYIVYIQK